MAYDETSPTASARRSMTRTGVTEKRMFGGRRFWLTGTWP